MMHPTRSKKGLPERVTKNERAIQVLIWVHIFPRRENNSAKPYREQPVYCIQEKERCDQRIRGKRERIPDEDQRGKQEPDARLLYPCTHLLPPCLQGPIHYPLQPEEWSFYSAISHYHSSTYILPWFPTAHRMLPKLLAKPPRPGPCRLPQARLRTVSPSLISSPFSLLIHIQALLTLACCPYYSLYKVPFPSALCMLSV